MDETYKTVGDLLEAVGRFHKQLSVFYARLLERSEKERVRMLLDYMSRHQKDFEQAMADYDEQAARRLLDTWIQFAPARDELSVPDPKDIEADMTVNEVVDIAMELDDQLSRFYAEAADYVDTDEIRELFARLQEQQEARKADIKRNAVAIRDYV